MQIEINKKEFKDLFLLVCIGEYVRGGIADERGEDFTYWEKTKERLLEIAKDEGFDDLWEDFKGHVIVKEQLSNDIDEIMDEHNESEFWHLLMVRLGQRDFHDETTKEDIEFIEKNHGMLPRKIDSYYKKYGDEFEEYDIDRLKIVE